MEPLRGLNVLFSEQFVVGLDHITSLQSHTDRTGEKKTGGITDDCHYINFEEQRQGPAVTSHGPRGQCGDQTEA